MTSVNSPAIDRRVEVIIPTYNERENLGSLVEGVLALGRGVTVIVVDDNSPDGTGKLADDISARFPSRITVLHRQKKQGIGPAYIAGFNAALKSDAEFIATMDADHSHDPKDLPRLVERAATSDLVLGSRYMEGGSTHGWPFHRKLISRIGGVYARIVLGVPVTDLTGGFKVYKRATLDALDLNAIESDGYAFQIETTYRTYKCGYCVAEEPISFVDRYAGKSKLSRMIVAEAAIVVWKLRFQRLSGKHRAAS